MNNKLVTGIIVGSIVGVAAATLFGTKKGKEIRGTAKDKVAEVHESTKEKADDFWDDVVDIVESAINQLDERRKK